MSWRTAGSAGESAALRLSRSNLCETVWRLGSYGGRRPLHRVAKQAARTVYSRARKRNHRATWRNTFRVTRCLSHDGDRKPVWITSFEKGLVEAWRPRACRGS